MWVIDQLTRPERDFINEFGFRIFWHWKNLPMPKVPLSSLRLRCEEVRKKTINGELC